MKSALAFLTIIYSLYITSCTENNPSSATNTQKGPYSPSIMGITVPDAYAGFTAYRATTSISSTITISTDNVAASLWNNTNFLSVDGGTLTLNGISIIKQSYGTNGIIYKSVDVDGSGNPDDVPLIFNGSYHVFNVSGTSMFSALIDSVISPTADLTVSYPLSTSTISKSSGFTLTWNGVGADTAHIMILDSDTTIGHVIFSKSMSDNGSLTITPTDLSPLQTGSIEIIVARGNYKIATDILNRAYLLSVYSKQTIHTTLTL